MLLKRLKRKEKLRKILLMRKLKAMQQQQRRRQEETNKEEKDRPTADGADEHEQEFERMRKLLMKRRPSKGVSEAYYEHFILSEWPALLNISMICAP
jgi:hypothetical protein